MTPGAPRAMLRYGLFVYVVLAPGTARAAGPADVELGARALGRAGAVVASADDLAALEYNPAALVGPERGWSAMSALTVVSHGVTYQPLGQVQLQRNQAPADLLPFAAFAVALSRSLLVAAGAYQAIAARYQWVECPMTPCPPATRSSLERFAFPLGLVLRTRAIVVGATLALQQIELDTASAHVSEAPAPSGSVGFVLAPGGAVRLGGSLTLPTDAGAASLPWVARAGIRVVLPHLDAEVGGSWEGWSSLGAPVPFRDTASVRAGLDLALAPAWLTLRAGWAWEKSAVAPADLSRELPDFDRHRIAAGGTACASGVCVDFAYTHAFAAAHGYAGYGLPAPDQPGRFEGRTDAVGFSLRVLWDRAAATLDR